MSVIRIATRYPKSLLELSNDQNKLSAVHADILTLQTAVQNRDLYLMLKSPIIQNDRKVAALDALFKSSMDPLTMGYLNLLVTKNREMYLPEIVAEFISQYKQLQKITSVTITTATEMSETLLADLRKKLLASDVTSDNLDVTAKVDPDLIGGFVLDFDNKRYDASVAHKLEELRSQFSKNLYVKEF